MSQAKEAETLSLNETAAVPAENEMVSAEDSQAEALPEEDAAAAGNSDPEGKTNNRVLGIMLAAVLVIGGGLFLRKRLKQRKH